jgi:WD40 repeat protein
MEYVEPEAFTSSVLTDDESTRLLKSGFPASLSAHVENALQVVPVSRIKPVASDGIAIHLGNEDFKIIRRVYSNYEYVKDGSWHTHTRWRLPTLEQDVLACIYSTHHDGLVRMQTVNRLIESRHDWTVPYLLHLISEYVVEIAELVDYRVSSVDSKRVQQFASHNPTFMSQVADRVISYWNVGHRTAHHSGADHRRYAWLEMYPAFNTLSYLGVWPRQHARNLLRSERMLRATRRARGLE